MQTDMKHDNTLRFCSVESSMAAIRILKHLGALEVRDSETRAKGGKKLLLNGEVFYVYARAAKR